MRAKHGAKNIHPREALKAHLDRTGWKVRQLAARLSSEDGPKAPLRYRALFDHYLRHPTGDIDIGSILCSRLDEAFALPRDSFRKLERKWTDERKGRGVQ